MSFKIMNGVEVYDKSEVDEIVESVNATSAQHTTDIQQLNQNKADKTYAQETRQIANDAKNAIGDDDQHGLRGRIKTVEDAIGNDNIANSIKGRINNLESHTVSPETVNQQLTNKADKNYAEQTRQITNNNSSAISALADRTTVLENNKANASDLGNTNDRVTALENNKANASDLNDTNNHVSALENDKANESDLNNTNDRVTALENNKANTSDIPDMVNSTLDSIINTKIALITSDINNIVGNAIDNEFDSREMSASEAVAIVNQYF